MSPSLFLLYLWSNDNQTWYDGTLRQNLSKAVKILLTSARHFWYRSRSKFEFPYLLSNGAEISSGVNSEALISNSSQKSRYKYVFKEKKAIFTKN